MKHEAINLRQETRRSHVYKALDENRFFKLVCGASLTDINIIENLAFIFTLAGAHVIDLAPTADVIFAARRGIQKALGLVSQGSWVSGLIGLLNQVPVLMASIQVDFDPHFRKATVNYDTCDLCGVCVKICPTEAFQIQTIGSRECPGSMVFKYNSERCFGCGICPDYCHASALDMVDIQPTPKEKLHEMMSLGVESIEFHFGSNYLRIKEIWDDIKDLVKSLKLLSFSIGSNLLRDGEIKEAARLSYMLAGSGIILQCDGIPMSGGICGTVKSGNINGKTYLHVAKVIQEEKLPVYLQISGGTDHNSFKEAIESGLRISGVAIGSYARKLLMPYLDKLDNREKLQEALNVATLLVNSVRGYHL